MNVFTFAGRVLQVAALNLGLALATTASADPGNYIVHNLVGNFGDGTINAFDTKNNTFAGQLRTGNGQVLVIEGLWGLAFGNNFRAQPANTLFFAAGPTDESDWLYGTIVPAPSPGEDNGQGNNQGGNGQGHGHLGGH